MVVIPICGGLIMGLLALVWPSDLDPGLRVLLAMLAASASALSLGVAIFVRERRRSGAEETAAHSVIPEQISKK